MTTCDVGGGGGQKSVKNALRHLWTTPKETLRQITESDNYDRDMTGTAALLTKSLDFEFCL